MARSPQTHRLQSLPGKAKKENRKFSELAHPWAESINATAASRLMPFFAVDKPVVTAGRFMIWELFACRSHPEIPGNSDEGEMTQS